MNKSASRFALCLVVLYALCGCSHKEYRLNFMRAQSAVEVGYFRALMMAAVVHDAWRDAIRDRRDINIALIAAKESLRDLNGVNEFEALESDQKIAAALMPMASNPPAEYQAAHAKLVDLYGTFGRFADLASNPTGSFQTYSAAHAELKAKFDEQDAQLKVLIPRSR